MNLSLTEAEARELKAALDVRVREMLDELAHTDDRAYHEDLKRMCDRLEAVQARVARLLEGERRVA